MPLANTLPVTAFQGRAEVADLISSFDWGDPSFEALATLTGQYDPSKPPVRSFRQRAEATSSALQNGLAAVVQRVFEATPRQRRSPKLAPNIELVALNLYAAQGLDWRMAVAIPMKSGWYSSELPRNPILSFRITVEGAIDGLIRAGLAVRVRKGSPWAGTHSLIRGTEALAVLLRGNGDQLPRTALRLSTHHDPIVLRAPKPGKAEDHADDPQDDDMVADEASADGLPIRFGDTPQTEAMRAAVLRVNATNTPDRITLPELDERERWALWEALRGEQKANLAGKVGDPKAAQRMQAPLPPESLEAWFADTCLHRVFNDGSFDLGGRFYGASWQALPKAWRKRILIDGEPVTELDFGSLHPRMAHNLLEGIEAPQDCYCGIMERINAGRETAKRTVSALLNMQNGIDRPPAWFSVDDAGKSWKALTEAAKDALPGIASHFGTGVGLRLQRVDSEIAEAVMLHFTSRVFRVWGCMTHSSWQPAMPMSCTP